MPQVRERSALEADRATARAETMLAVAPLVGIDVEALAFLARRFERRLGMLDAAEPSERLDLAALVSQDFDDLAGAFKLLAAALERGGEA